MSEYYNNGNGYSEFYRSEEYNTYPKESNVYETKNITEYNDEAKSESSSTVAEKKKNLLTNGMLAAVGGVVGTTVITATVFVMAVLQVTVLSFAVTMRSISVDFKIENASGSVLTAYLTGESGEYSAPIELTDGNCNVYFDSLVPDSVYKLEIRDEENNVHYTGKYVTEAFFPDMVTLVTETEITMEFIVINPDGLDFTVGIDGCDEPREFYTLSEIGETTAVFDMLEPGGDYAVCIVGSDGECYFYRELTTRAIAEPLICDVTIMAYSSINLRFHSAQLGNKTFDIYVDNEDINYEISYENSECYLEGFLSGQTVIIEAKDALTQELRMWLKVKIPTPQAM